jgi:hypothetical protein
LKRFSPGTPPNSGFLTIVEEIPGEVEMRDMTESLLQTEDVIGMPPSVLSVILIVYAPEYKVTGLLITSHTSRTFTVNLETASFAKQQLKCAITIVPGRTYSASATRRCVMQLSNGPHVRF